MTTKTKTPKHDTPTVETLLHGVWTEDHLSSVAGGGKRLRRLDSDALDKALMDGHVSMDQHTTLEEFRGQLYKAGLVFCPRAGMDVSGTSGQGQFLGDAAFSRALRVGKQMNALAGRLTAPDLNLLLGVLTMDLQVTKANAPVMVQSASVLDEFRNGKR